MGQAKRRGNRDERIAQATRRFATEQAEASSKKMKFENSEKEEPVEIEFDVFKKAFDNVCISTTIKATRRIFFNYLDKKVEERGFFHVDAMYGAGSGILVKHEHTFYLLTADHVIGNATSYKFLNESPFWIPSQANCFPQELDAFLMPARIIHIGDTVPDQGKRYESKDMILIELFFPSVKHMPDHFLDLDANPDLLATREVFFSGQYLVSAGYPFDKNSFEWFDEKRADGMTHSTQVSRLIVDGVCEIDEGEPIVSRRLHSGTFPNLSGASGGIVTNIPEPAKIVKMLGMMVSAGSTIVRFIPSYVIAEALSLKQSAKVTSVDPAFKGQPILLMRKMFLDLSGHGTDEDSVNRETVEYYNPLNPIG